MSAFAEFERDRIGDRLRATKRAQKARSEYLGGKAPVRLQRMRATVAITADGMHHLRSFWGCRKECLKAFRPVPHPRNLPEGRALAPVEPTGLVG